MKYHINDDGDPGKCNAEKAPCPYGSESEHYPTEAAARRAYENRSVTFDVNKLLKKKKQIQEDIYQNNALNNEGLTENMSSFKYALYDVAQNIKTYQAYRRTGLDEDSYRPTPPEYLNGYLNNEAVELAWRRGQFEKIRELYSDAIRTYYLENVFTSEDVDVMISDEEIQNLTEYKK